MRRRLSLVAAALALASCSTPAVAREPLGAKPAYLTRPLGTTPPGPLPNEAAITTRIWAPGLDDGYVPQGLAVADGTIIIAAYRSPDATRSTGPCRLYRIAAATGEITGTLDLPPSCGHAGGLALTAPGRIWVVDTHVMHEIELAPTGPQTLGNVIREVKIDPPLKGSLATAQGADIVLGSYDRDKPGLLWRIPLASITGASVGAQHVTATIEIPSRAQGAAFDAQGRLWIARSGAALGELAVLDPKSAGITTSYRVPDGVEGIAFAGNTLWTVSEAGSRRWSNWATVFPLVFALDLAKLR